MPGTDLAGALADTTALEPFEGKDVRRASIEIPNAAGGLRDAMKIEPRTFRQGERVFLVMECVVQKVRFDPIDKDAPGGDQERVHVFMADVTTFVDEGLVKDVLTAQREAIEKAKDEAAGRQKIPFDGETAEGDDPQGGDEAGDDDVTPLSEPLAETVNDLATRRKSKRAAAGDEPQGAEG